MGTWPLLIKDLIHFPTYQEHFGSVGNIVPFYFLLTVFVGKDIFSFPLYVLHSLILCSYQVSN